MLAMRSLPKPMATANLALGICKVSLKARSLEPISFSRSETIQDSLSSWGRKIHQKRALQIYNILQSCKRNGEPSAQKAEVAAPARSDGGGQGFGSYLLPSSASAVRRAQESKDSPPAPGVEFKPGQHN